MTWTKPLLQNNRRYVRKARPDRVRHVITIGTSLLKNICQRQKKVDGLYCRPKNQDEKAVDEAFLP